MIKELKVEELYLRAMKRKSVYQFIAKNLDSIWTGFLNVPSFNNDSEQWEANSGTFGILGVMESELSLIDISCNRIESQNGYKILCGYNIPIEMIKSGQKWIAGNLVVTISNVESKSGQLSEIEYEWIENGELIRNKKDCFNFQCRYSLILEKEN